MVNKREVMINPISYQNDTQNGGQWQKLNLTLTR